MPEAQVAQLQVDTFTYKHKPFYFIQTKPKGRETVNVILVDV